MPDTDDMREQEGRPIRSDGGWVPTPDPTKLTTDIVNDAKEDLRREVAAQRELIEARVARTEGNIDRNADLITAAAKTFADEIAALHTEFDRRFVAHDTEDARIRGDITAAVENLERLHEERFTAIAQQFTERDIRSEQDKKSSKEALDAALLAAKEAVSQQNDANTTAAAKSETSFTKQIDQIGVLIATLEKSLTDRITELKERIDRGEGGVQGVRQSETDRHAQISSTTAILLAMAAFISIIVVIAVATHGFVK